jgi:POT family proton-dependent oligopeptide transporter
MAKHPKGLYLLFVTEMWERFSYYGMRAIFVLYLTNALLFDKSLASKIYGSYTGLVYLTPLLGGYVADRYWGNRRSIIVGGALMALGQFCLFLSGTFYQDRGLATGVMFAGLGLLIVGNGFFKPNISTMVGQLYPAHDRRIDAAFTIFYMGINLGAFLSPLVCGTLGEHYDAEHHPLPEYFRWGFLAACVGMLVSLAFFVAYKNRYIVTPDGKPIGAEPNKARDAEAPQAAESAAAESAGSAIAWEHIAVWAGVFLVLALVLYYGFALGFTGNLGANLKALFTTRPDLNAVVSAVIFAASVAMPGLIISDRSLTPVERERVWVIYISAFFVIFFWSAFEQAGASLTFFAEEQTNRTVNLHVPLYAAHLASAAIVGVLAAIFVWGRRALREEPASLSVILYALLAAALGYVVYQNVAWVREGRSALVADEVPASYFQSINAIAIVLFAPLFSGLWTRLGSRNLEPPSVVKQALGLALLALGFLVIALRVHDLNPAVKVSMFWLVALYVIHTWGELCLSPIGLGMVAKLSPVRFASLLMGVWFLANATANTFAGLLSALYPPSEHEFREAAKVGIDLPAILNKTASATPDQLEKLKEIGVRASYPQLFGIEVHDLFQFFMIFVISAGLASILLLLISRKLIRMMHGVR